MYKLKKLAILFLAFALFASCAPITSLQPVPTQKGADPTQAPASLPATSTPAVLPTLDPATPTPGVPAQNGLVVTLADDGKTFTIKVGERFLLMLGEDYQWSPISSDLSVLSRVPNIAVIRGAQGIYEAHKPGQAELTATGDLPCRSATPPCMAPSRLFKVTIVVQ